MDEIISSIKVPKIIFLDLSSRNSTELKFLFNENDERLEIVKLDISRNKLTMIDNLKIFIKEDLLEELYCNDNHIEFLGMNIKLSNLKILYCKSYIVIKTLY